MGKRIIRLAERHMLGNMLLIFTKKTRSERKFSKTFIMKISRIGSRKSVIFIEKQS